MIALPITPRDGEPAPQCEYTTTPHQALLCCSQLTIESTVLDQQPANNQVSTAPFRSPRSPRSDRDRIHNHTPSISPLSTASRANIDHERESQLSPIGLRRSLEPSYTSHDAHPAHVDVVVQQDDDDDRSSSLSDFDGSSDEQDDPIPQADPAPLSPLPPDEADSEAETERLERTPQKPWKSVDVGRTPSKLNQQSTYDDDLSEPASSPEALASPTHKPIGKSVHSVCHASTNIPFLRRTTSACR